MRDGSFIIRKNPIDSMSRKHDIGFVYTSKKAFFEGESESALVSSPNIIVFELKAKNSSVFS